MTFLKHYRHAPHQRRSSIIYTAGRTCASEKCKRSAKASIRNAAFRGKMTGIGQQQASGKPLQDLAVALLEMPADENRHRPRHELPADKG